MIKRELLKSLKEHLPKKEISLITGPRQSGKTTIMMLLKEELDRKGEPTLFLNLDIEEHASFFSSQTLLKKKIELELGKNRGFVFIDEIQRKENAGLFLKGLYDMDLPYKLIVSGSGSLELKGKIHESLLGRKKLFELSTVSFHEFLNYMTNYKYEDRIERFYSIEKERTREYILEYLNFGGYPRVILEERQSDKQSIINEIFRSYIEKDISYLLKVEKIEAFESMVMFLASQTGQLVNFSELSSSVGTSVVTILNYIKYGEGTFIFKKLTPFFRNVRNEITKSPKIYFTDLGFRNYSLGKFGLLSDPADLGAVFENFIFLILKEKISNSPFGLHFWRTKDKAEVDFILNISGNIIPFEVKFNGKGKISRSFRNFLSRYVPSKAYIVTSNYENKINIGNTYVEFIPFWQLYLDNHLWSILNEKGKAKNGISNNE